MDNSIYLTLWIRKVKYMKRKTINEYLDYLKYEKHYSKNTITSYRDDIVEYFDYISSRNYYILYRASLNPRVQSNEVGLVLVGEDLNKLNLFYAGTTHELQGSQAKLIIFVLGVVNFKGFITRQMLYTMTTRGESLVFGVGSVGNEQASMLSQARRDIASVDVKTVGELLV